ncbi:MAG: trypsin-like peptidase domain-containing protein, partial [Desulfosarcina sp.]|nr:trypsin-like peptidase domain-containing protein [Desulfobacterales bacterium]
MKICIKCGQIVAEAVNTCPTCGAEVTAGRTTIGDYRILEVLHEGYASILCKARREGDAEPVMIRIFTPPAGVDARLAERLQRELEELRELPESYFVRHLAIRQSAEGLWYRISEWVETMSWGTLLASGRLQEPRVSLNLFARIASILEGLHRIGHIIPHLILDDILVYEDEAGVLKVKIDYKLSRLLDPQLDRPGPMLARLLALHPDIVHRGPLDHRSDIWSLGKIFVEILAADPDVTDLTAQVDTLSVPPEIRTLIRLMLSEAPELRPGTMAEVTAALGRVSERAIAEAADRACEPPGALTRVLRGLNLRLGLLMVLLTLLIVVGGLLWYHLGARKPDSETALRGYANQYAGSVAFVVVDYSLHLGDKEVYHNRSEGTAFLADARGYMPTNRHVACPWLEDARLLMTIGLLRQRPEKLNFSYRIFLWFEGQRAFARLPGFSEDDAVEDIYRTETAFNSRGPRRVRIAGVAPVLVKTGERVRAPLGDDFAVLKIDEVPPGLAPLPLAADFEAARIPKLTPLITLGFPLGSSTQAATVNVSVTSGHVRRTFENMLQVDTSIHPGNSGGP